MLILEINFLRIFSLNSFPNWMDLMILGDWASCDLVGLGLSWLFPFQSSYQSFTVYGIHLSWRWIQQISRYITTTFIQIGVGEWNILPCVIFEFMSRIMKRKRSENNMMMSGWHLTLHGVLQRQQLFLEFMPYVWHSYSYLFRYSWGWTLVKLVTW